MQAHSQQEEVATYPYARLTQEEEESPVVPHRRKKKTHNNDVQIFTTEKNDLDGKVTGHYRHSNVTFTVRTLTTTTTGSSGIVMPKKEDGGDEQQKQQQQKKCTIYEDTLHTLRLDTHEHRKGRIAVCDARHPELGYAELTFDGVDIRGFYVDAEHRHFTPAELPLQVGDVELDAADKRVYTSELERILPEVLKEGSKRKHRPWRSDPDYDSEEDA
jgi:hypothetical protein